MRPYETTSVPNASLLGFVLRAHAWWRWQYHGGHAVAVWTDMYANRYDILIDDGAAVEYVEVKATRAADKHYFEMSYNEWSFAQKEGDDFTVFRVVAAGDVSRASILAITNPYLKWKQGQLGMAVAL